MKYLFRDRIPNGRSLSTFLKNSGDTHPDHHDYHPHFELYFRCSPLPQEIVLNGEHMAVDGPAVVLTAPFQIHAMSPQEAIPVFERHVIYFNTALIGRIEGLLSEEFFTQNSNSLFVLTEKEAYVLENLLQDLFDEALPEQERALTLALCLCRLDRMVEPTRRHRFGQIKTYIPQILRHLYDSTARDLSAEAIAARFHVSRAKLNRDFRASVGQSLHAAVIDLRLSRAKALLADSNLSVEEVARSCGFLSEGYFYTFFKRNVGITPLQYRQSVD